MCSVGTVGVSVGGWRRHFRNLTLVLGYEILEMHHQRIANLTIERRAGHATESVGESTLPVGRILAVDQGLEGRILRRELLTAQPIDARWHNIPAHRHHRDPVFACLTAWPKD